MTTHAASRPLLRTEAEARSALLQVRSYDLDLDLDADLDARNEHFTSRTVIRLTSGAGSTFLDLKPVEARSATLDGVALDLDTLTEGRLPLTLEAGEHEIVVEAVMGFRTDGEGLHRFVDPADGQAYVYGMSFMDAAPSVFACFDQPDLKAPYTVRARVPEAWIVRGNGRAEQVEPGVWQLAATPPLATYFVTLVAGPYRVVEAEHDGIRLGLSARASLGDRLEEQAEELFTITRQSLDELHRLFGVRYAFGDYHQAFVPEFNAGAMENPGCITIRDQLIFLGPAPRAEHVWRAALIAHEMAHQWFGDLVTPRWWDDLWLNESFAEYLGNRVAAEATEYDDAWTEVAFSRRQWGLSADLRRSTHPVAGNGAQDNQSALQDFDGISYAKGSSILAQIAATLGDDAFFGGVRALFEERRFGNIALADVVRAWEQASGTDLGEQVGQWLRTSGPDVLELDRATSTITRTVPSHDRADRRHRITVARHAGEAWRVEEVEVGGEPAALSPALGADETVVVDPHLRTWAATLLDDASAAGLVDLLPDLDDPLMRATVWSNVRTSVRLARLSPARAVDLAVAAFPVEDTGLTGRRTIPWILGWLLPLAPEGSLVRVHDAVRAVLDAAAPGSEPQATAFKTAVSTSTDPALLRGWLETPPDGVVLDLDLRWRTWVRLATLGDAEQPELDAVLAAEHTDAAVLEHAKALASRPTAEAKAWAWQRFTGEVEVPNYELEAVGVGLWRAGQESVTAPYVERYFADLPATAGTRSGWVLATSAETFFPSVSLSPATLAAARAAADDDALPPAVRRRLSDAADDLEARLAVVAAFPRA